MVAIELWNMYAMDTACERDIFRIVSPIDLKLDLSCLTTLRMDAIDFGPSAQTKLAAIGLIKYM